MSEADAQRVPAEFEQLPSGLGFTDSLQPSYRRIADGKASFGLVVQAQHSNTMGICHGGVLMTLADITAATGVNGQWVQADVEQVSIKRRFGFCSGGIYNSAGVVARFSGTFYFPDHSGMWKDGRRGDGVLHKQPD